MCSHVSWICYITLFGSITTVSAISSGVLTSFSLSTSQVAAELELYETSQTRTAQECCMLCVKDDHCYSVSYNELKDKCSKSETISGIDTRPGWSVYEILKFSGNRASLSFLF